MLIVRNKDNKDEKDDKNDKDPFPPRYRREESSGWRSDRR